MCKQSNPTCTTDQKPSFSPRLTIGPNNRNCFLGTSDKGPAMQHVALTMTSPVHRTPVIALSGGFGPPSPLCPWVHRSTQPCHRVLATKAYKRAKLKGEGLCNAHLLSWFLLAVTVTVTVTVTDMGSQPTVDCTIIDMANLGHQAVDMSRSSETPPHPEHSYPPGVPTDILVQP